jgi:hypothetical protein
MIQKPQRQIAVILTVKMQVIERSVPCQKVKRIPKQHILNKLKLLEMLRKAKNQLLQATSHMMKMSLMTGMIQVQAPGQTPLRLMKI